MFGLCSLKLFLKTVYENIENTKKVFYENRVMETRRTKKSGVPFSPNKFLVFFYFIFQNKKLFLKIGTKQLLWLKHLHEFSFF